MTATTPPANGATNWGSPLNDYLVNDLQATITQNTANLTNHAANSPADPHGDRAYALGLMAPILANVNAAGGFVQLNGSGLIPVALIPTPVFPATALGPLLATPAGGYALQNGTPTILTWVAPSDGNNHRVELFGQLVVTSAETGGQVSVTYTDPAGNAHTVTLVAAGQGTGPASLAVTRFVIKSGSTFTVSQSTALTAGAGTLWCEIWGS